MWLRARGEALLVVLATGLFAAGLCFVPPTVFETEGYVSYWKPTLRFLADAVLDGRSPLWNPYVGLGRPFLADMQNIVCYPPAYLVCAGQQIGVFVLAWLHCLLAVLGFKRLGAALETGRWQSYFMGFSFIASGELTARWMAGQISYCWGLCYVPWLFYFALRTEEQWQWLRLALYAALLALQFLCGHPQVFWFSAVGQGVFIFARALRLPLREALRDAVRSVCQFGVAGIWCSGLVAAVLLPMLELIKEGNRSGASAAFADSFRFAWGNLRYLFSPLHAGDINWESNVFVGTIIVGLGLAGLCRVRERNVRGLLAILVIGLLIAAGRTTPFFVLLYKCLPGFAGFRLHTRAALLAVFALTCAAGIWLGRPHPRVRACWSYLFGLPIHYAVIGLLLLQALDLLQATWMIKKVYTHAVTMILQAAPEHSFDRTLVAELHRAGLMKPSQPPPRVCVSPSLVPANYGMIYHYSGFDADCSLFLRRPWDYLHAVLRIPPPGEKGSLSRQVYSHGAFPYRDLSLAVGMDPRQGALELAVDPSPRAFVVYGADVADYRAALDRLAHGYDIRQRALLEKPLAELPGPGKLLPATPASIRRFEPNSLLVEANAKERGLLVLAEAWYPGWRAEVDGRACACVPANTWMRAVPLLPGRHQVRLYFHQDYLLPGLLISAISTGLVLLALVKPGGRSVPTPAHRDVVQEPAASPADAGSGAQQKATPLTERPEAVSGYRQPLRAVTSGLLVLAVVATTEIPRWRGFQSEARAVEVETQCYLGLSLHAQRRVSQAITHYTETLRLKPDHVMALYKLAWIRAAYPQAEFRNGAEAVRLAQRACELTRYQAPAPLETLAAAYAEAGRFADASAIADTARQLALAAGQPALAERPMKMLKLFADRKPYREADRN
jgi:tetratricopeptide (TPR) repeat protein